MSEILIHHYLIYQKKLNRKRSGLHAILLMKKH